jgi:hypothetical protein
MEADDVASWRALEATAAAVLGLLRDDRDRTTFGPDLDLQLYTVNDFRQPMVSGVSVIAFRMEVDGTHRAPEPPRDELGRRRLTQLPLDLSLLLTAWAGDASLQLSIATWMMRVLADNPVLSPSQLNAAVAGTFDADEFVALQPLPVPTEDLLRLWELLGPTSFQLSVPYLARGARIDSSIVVDEHEMVVEREFQYRGVRR